MEHSCWLQISPAGFPVVQWHGWGLSTSPSRVWSSLCYAKRLWLFHRHSVIQYPQNTQSQPSGMGDLNMTSP